MTNRLHIGCSSYYNSNWRGDFYPEEMPRKEWFAYYCQHFSTYEINATFYKPPTIKTLKTWYEKAPQDFIFAVKAPKLITHIKRFSDCEEAIQDFYASCREGLKEKLGPVLFQLPPSFKYTDENFQKVLKNLDGTFQNVVEFRHVSWWNENVWKIMEEHKVTFCSVSHPALSDEVVKTNALGYFRLHGNPKMFYSSYDTDYLKKIKNILDQKKFEKCFVFFNNTASTAGILNALEMNAL